MKSEPSKLARPGEGGELRGGIRIELRLAVRRGARAWNWEAKDLIGRMDEGGA